MTRFNRFAAGATVASLAIVALAASVLAAQGVLTFADGTPDELAPPTITTEVRPGLLVESVQGGVAVSSSSTVDVGGAGIVTRAGATAGSLIEEGQVIATIGERPILALSGSVPMYRALGPGDTGTDVTQLQSALTRLGQPVADKPGLYGNGTARGLFRLFLDRGFTPVDAGGVPVTSATSRTTALRQNEAYFFAALPATAKTTCGSPGDVAEAALCQIDVGPSTATVSVTDSRGERVLDGMRVDIETSDGRIVGGAIAGPAAPAEVDQDEQAGVGSSTPRGNSFNIALDDLSVLKAGDTGQGTVVLASGNETDLVIEASALREGDDGSIWVKSVAGDRIEVQLGLCSGGLCAVSGVEIVEGVRIAIPRPASAATAAR